MLILYLGRFRLDYGKVGVYTPELNKVQSNASREVPSPTQRAEEEVLLAEHSEQR